MKKSITTEKWTGRQAAVELENNRWRVSFLATTQGSITNLGGMVAEYVTPKFDEVPQAISEWITTGLVPAGFETHCKDWFAEYDALRNDTFGFPTQPPRGAKVGKPEDSGSVQTSTGLDNPQETKK